jgi:uncharacterized protein (TIGR03000 family)
MAFPADHALDIRRTYTMRFVTTASALALMLTTLSGAVAQEPKPAPAKPRVASIHVTCPANATLTLNGEKTTQTGEDRWFITPPLDPGKNYSATLKITFVRDGSAFTVERKVTLHAGRAAHVHFLPKQNFSHFHEPSPYYPPPAPPVIEQEGPQDQEDWDFF